MRRAALVSVFALCVGCGGGDDGGGGAADADTGGGVDAPPGTTGLSLTGSACSASINFSSTAPLYVMRDGNGDLLGLIVADGDPALDTESETAWGAYAGTSDVYLILAFDQPESPTPHTVNAIFDSLFAARDVGAVAFKEHNAGEQIDISAFDATASTIRASLTLPVAGFVDTYPPRFSLVDTCNRGQLVGQVVGSFTELSQ